MIQRKQTVFLLLALVAVIVCLCMPLGTVELRTMGVAPVLYNMALAQAGSYDFAYCPLFVLLALSGILSLTAIFTYKNRKRQMRLCQLNLLALCLWYVLFMYDIFCAFDGHFHQYVTATLPFVAAVLQWLAYRGIRADEKLVRAADRIR